MADIDPYRFGDASDAERLRFLQQQYAEASTAKRVTREDRSVERQSLKELGAEIERLERKIERDGRMHRIYTRHVRAY